MLNLWDDLKSILMIPKLVSIWILFNFYWLIFLFLFSLQEIHQLLMDREDTCHRTCFSLQLDGNTLDNFAELKNIEGLKDGSIIKVVEEPYTMREARIHVRHVRDLLKSVDPADAYNGVECSSLSFLNVVTNGDILEKKKTRADSVDCTPPDYIIPGCRDRPLLPLQPQAKEQKCPPCLKVSNSWKLV